MNNRDVQRMELFLPGQPVEGSGITVNDGEVVTTVLPHRARASMPSNVVENSGREVLPAYQEGRMTSVEAISSLAQDTVSLTLEKPDVQPDWQSRPIQHLQSEFLRICLPLFFDEQRPIHTLGITSALAGEGKTSVAWLVSHALATSSQQSVVLVECNWERPTFSKGLGLPASPGLAEFLSGANDRSEVRYQFLSNLVVIPAGVGGPGALSALAQLQRLELHDRLAGPDELMILDLPSVLGSHYGTIAARLAESLVLVVRAGATPSPVVAQACDELKRLQVEGIVLNQVQTRIPRWLQRLL